MTELDLDALRTLQRLISRLNTGADLSATLRAVVDGVVEGLGFQVAVVSLVRDDRTVEVVTVAGPEDVSATLLGNVCPLASWEKAFERSHAWGALRFEPHELAEQDDIPSWVPDTPVVEDDDAWHPLDALFAPLYSVSGHLVGIMSVDLPEDGRKPGEIQRELLEMYATQAGIAIDNAQLSERLRASEEAFRLAFENAPVGMSIIDFGAEAPGRFLRVNEAMCRMLGYSRRELQDGAVHNITHPDDRDADMGVLRGARSGEHDRYQLEKRYVRADGRPVWVSLQMSVVRDSNGTALFGISQFEDISDRRAEHQELTRRARIDALTGLLNRAALAERVEAAIAEARTGGRHGALLFCDLDEFKPVNDTFGHGTGDRVLAIVARRLEGQIRARDTAARFGGDEFVIVADDLGGAMLADLVTRLREAVAAPIEVDGVTVDLAVTVGTVAVTGADGESADALIAAADMDMYLRKPGPSAVTLAAQQRAAARRGGGGA
jgi:diguanylate cyclase (GGDEF)-like protein/PAS domain S-box-containing protein